jgi:hypothetical protein
MMAINDGLGEKRRESRIPATHRTWKLFKLEQAVLD